MFECLTNLSDIQVLYPIVCSVGIKQCPNSECMALVYVVMDSNQRAIQSYPTERIDFDTSNIPQAIVSCMDEALSCHANRSYVACAIMVRRTLELLCEAKSATGATLKDRLANLKMKVVLPQELFVAMDELRLLGNDAAHIEAKTYSEVSEEETSAAIELTKEILKAVYQLDELVKRLQALKRP